MSLTTHCIVFVIQIMTFRKCIHLFITVYVKDHNNNTRYVRYVNFKCVIYHSMCIRMCVSLCVSQCLSQCDGTLSIERDLSQHADSIVVIFVQVGVFIIVFIGV